jgi:hypothetical protein
MTTHTIGTGRTPQGRGDDPEGSPQRHDEYAKGAP